jgi:hypothetical protein
MWGLASRLGGLIVCVIVVRGEREGVRGVIHWMVQRWGWERKVEMSLQVMEGVV